MYALEFETYISGDTVKIPAHLLSRLPTQKHVKIILFLPEEDASVAHKTDLKSEILEIGGNCAALPLLDSRTPGEILGYDNSGLPR